MKWTRCLVYIVIVMNDFAISCVHSILIGLYMYTKSTYLLAQTFPFTNKLGTVVAYSFSPFLLSVLIICDIIYL